MEHVWTNLSVSCNIRRKNKMCFHLLWGIGPVHSASLFSFVDSVVLCRDLFACHSLQSCGHCFGFRVWDCRSCGHRFGLMLFWAESTGWDPSVGRKWKLVGSWRLRSNSWTHSQTHVRTQCPVVVGLVRFCGTGPFFRSEELSNKVTPAGGIQNTVLLRLVSRSLAHHFGPPLPSCAWKPRFLVTVTLAAHPVMAKRLTTGPRNEASRTTSRCASRGPGLLLTDSSLHTYRVCSRLLCCPRCHGVFNNSVSPSSWNDRCTPTHQIWTMFSSPRSRSGLTSPRPPTKRGASVAWLP